MQKYSHYCVEHGDSVSYSYSILIANGQSCNGKKSTPTLHIGGVMIQISRKQASEIIRHAKRFAKIDANFE